jgi:hypothetical protein
VASPRRTAARLYLWAPQHYLRAHVAFVLLLVGGGLLGAVVAVVLGRKAWPGVGAGVVATSVAVVAVVIYTLAVVLACRVRSVPLETVAEGR